MKRYCRNCYNPLLKKASFCERCGQKNTDGKVKMSTMLLKLWNTTFHLEGKFLRSCWQLFIPGKVTVEMFKGKQSRYPHPIRMFAIVMFFLLFMVNTVLKDVNTKNNGGAFTFSTSKKASGQKTKIEEQQLSEYEKMKFRLLLLDMQADYEVLPDSLKTVESRMAMDSILLKYSIRNGVKYDGLLDSLNTELDTINIVLWRGNALNLATLDLVRYEPNELIERYGITQWDEKLLVGQAVKSYKNPDGLVHAYLGSLTWAILAQVSTMSAILALLYWRQRRFFVEHFLFLLHFHTGLMLAFLLVILGVKFDFFSLWSLSWVFFWATFSMLLAMRRYYEQSWWKTILKWLIFGFLYFIFFTLLLVLGLILVFAMY